MADKFKYSSWMFPNVRYTLMSIGHGTALVDIRLDKKNQGKGYGSEFMEKLVEDADSLDEILVLTPVLDYGATSIARLEKFYSWFGFVKNKGKNKDFRFNHSMIRLPNQGG